MALRPAADESTVSPTSPATQQSSSPCVAAGESSSLAGDNDPDSGDRCFVGDLNPEATFLAGATPSTNTSVIDRDKLGVWLSRRPGSYPIRQPQSTCIYSPDPLISKLFLPYLEQHCLSLLPSPPHFDGLRAIYIRDIHPIFPVLDADILSTFPSSTPASVILAQAVCLAASATSGPNNFLRLSSAPDTLLLPDEFAQQLSLAMLTTINLGIIKDKTVTIRVLALLSLFNQLSDDRYFSAELTGRAVSHAQALGLHLHYDAARQGSTSTTQLFCCVWALDRLNSAFHGRPTLIHERDISRDFDACINQQEPCFRLFLRTVELLDQAIDLYRPDKADNTSDYFMNDRFPTFEDLAHNSGADFVSVRLMASIETLYHAVVILSCRSRSPQASARSSTSCVRQSLSAGRISAIVREDLSEDMSLIPMIPYAVSLSLRVFYRDFRTSKAAIFRLRARKEVLNSCSILRRLGTTFASAVVMANLAEEAVREGEDVVPESQSLRSAQGNVDGEPSSEGAYPSPRDPFPGAVEAAAGDGSGGRAAQDGWTTSRSDSAERRLFDSAIFETMPDLDIFAHFDLDFNPNALETLLQDNVPS